MKNKEKALNELKAELEKEQNRAISDAEMQQVDSFLTTMAELAVDVALEEQRRLEKLKESPGGFHMDKPGYSCTICSRPASGENSWFDKHGLKCGACQGAINRKAIPPSLGKNKDSWYSGTELEIYFNLKATVQRQWIKKGLLVARTIAPVGKGGALLVFLIKENKAMLPPKKLLKGGIIKEVVNGREEHVFAPWYWFVDPKEHLKGYGIGEWLKFVPDRG